MRKTGIALLALSLCAALVFGTGLQQNPAQPAAMTKTEMKQEMNGSAPVKTVKVDGEDRPYDFSLTTFNVGHFELGTTDGVNQYAWGKDVSDRCLREWYNDIPKYAAKSDIFTLLEFGEKFYWENEADGGEYVTSDEVFLGNTNINSDLTFTRNGTPGPFKQLQRETHLVHDKMWNMDNAIGISRLSDLEMTDFTYGFFSGRSEAYKRLWVKAYVEIKGVRVAVYAVHLGFDDHNSWLDSYNELIKMAYNEDYCIIAGDMNNGDELRNVMTNAGLNVANWRMKSYMYDSECDTEYSAIDNVFTTPNINIEHAEVVQDDCGGSDHWPLTVYLTVDTEMGSTKGTHTVAKDADGYVASYH